MPSYSAEPVVITMQATAPGQYAPEPLVAIGGLPAATPALPGGVKQGVAVPDAAGASPTAAEFKALLDSLRAAGVIA